MSDILNESSTVINDVTESTSLDDDISNITDIHVMLLAENMSAFDNEDQVSDGIDFYA